MHYFFIRITITITMFTFTNCEWIECTFQRRECCKTIPSTKDDTKCSCGRSISSHEDLSYTSSYEDIKHWNPAKHTIGLPTDAYGCIDFRGGSQTNKAQYIRLSYDTKSELVLTLLLREWCLEKPKLLISVNGGKANFDLQPKLKRTLRKGLLKAAKTSGAWIFTGGTNNGVTKHVGEALISEKSPRIKGDRVVSIGISSWGIVENRKDLIGRNKENAFHSQSGYPRSKFVSLNKNHAYFLLVDNGTVGKYGAEIALRRKLEKFISTQRLGNESHQLRDFSTPLVCLVIEGGTNTIRSVLEYVTDSPPVPVVVCDGTGRAADLLAFAHKYVGDDGDLTRLDAQMMEQFKFTIRKTFNASVEQGDRLYHELLQCVKRKNLITIFRCSGGSGEETELDQVILTALFKSKQLSPMEQLSLALSWNRSDIAKKEIFPNGKVPLVNSSSFHRSEFPVSMWPRGALDEAMYEALVNNRVNFVRLLLENGVNMKRFLTIQCLEDLYNSDNGPANTLEYLVRDVVPRMPRGYRYTLIDIGNVVNLLMGSGYQSNYSLRKFRLRYDLCQISNSSVKEGGGGAGGVRILKKSLTNTTLKVPKFLQSHSLSSNSPHSIFTSEMSGMEFERPFTELILWAVLTKRQEMAKLMWEHGEQSLAKALLASRLYKAMAHEAADDDLEVEIYEELLGYANTFCDLSLGLLDFCYQSDVDLTRHLLTASLQDFSRQTCLSLGDISHHLSFLSHPLCQTILADLWMGGLRMRKNPGFKIVLGLLFPPSIVTLEFKTKEELDLMPRTEEEHDQEGSGESSSSSSSSSSTSSHDSRRSSLPLNTSQRSLELGDLNDSSSGLPHTSGLPELFKDTSYSNSPLSPYSHKKKTRPLKWKKKLYEFYAAPITKFYCHSMAYMIFLVLYSYVCLVKTPVRPSWEELYVVSFLITFGFEKTREIIAMEPSGFLQKLVVWIQDTRWNIFDSFAILIFLTGFFLRILDPSEFLNSAHVIYSTDVTYWYVRSLKLLSVNKYFGPFVMMMGQMIENMIYFVILLLVVLMAFGVCRQSILHPNEEPDWILIRHVFYQPYFMLYGEVFAPDINPECDPNCKNDGECGESKIDGSLLVPCHAGRWITPIVMTIYLLVANVLLINLLIALFNTIYNTVNSISHQLWNFQRFAVVMEYEEKPILPPPLIFISHIFRIAKYLYRGCKNGDRKRFESGLKLFLSKHELERLYDFEEECIEGFLRSHSSHSSHSVNETETQIKNLQEMTEEMKQKIEEEVNNLERSRNLEFTLSRVEEMVERTKYHLSILHRAFLYSSPSETKSPLGKALGSSHLKASSSEENDDDDEDLVSRVFLPKCSLDVHLSKSNPRVSSSNHNHIYRSSSNPTDSELEAFTSQRRHEISQRRIYATPRDYTSITDELEILFPSILPSEHIESLKDDDNLHNAEETDYKLMESVIQRRLRRDSTNLTDSLEDLITPSLIDSSSIKGSENNSSAQTSSIPNIN